MNPNHNTKNINEFSAEYKELKRSLIRQSRNETYRLGLEDIFDSLNKGWKLEELDFEDIKFLIKMFTGQVLEKEPDIETQDEILFDYISVKNAELSEQNKISVARYFTDFLLPLWREVKKK